MKIENYDITKLTNNKKLDFEDIFKNIDNYINQKFNYYEYINKLEELELSDYVIKRESDNNYRNFSNEELLYLRNKLRNNYLNIYLFKKLYKNKKSSKKYNR